MQSSDLSGAYDILTHMCVRLCTEVFVCESGQPAEL